MEEAITAEKLVISHFSFSHICHMSIKLNFLSKSFYMAERAIGSVLLHKNTPKNGVNFQFGSHPDTFSLFSEFFSAESL